MKITTVNVGKDPKNATLLMRDVGMAGSSDQVNAQKEIINQSNLSVQVRVSDLSSEPHQNDNKQAKNNATNVTDRIKIK